MANESQKAEAAKDAVIQELKAKLDAGEVARELAVSEALSALERENNQLANDLSQANQEKEAAAKLAQATLAIELQKTAASKDSEIQDLKAKLDAIEIAKKLAITEAVGCPLMRLFPPTTQ